VVGKLDGSSFEDQSDNENKIYRV